MTWIYLGNDSIFGHVEITKSGSVVRLRFYIGKWKGFKVFTLKSGLGFIYLLNLDKYLSRKKHILPHLWCRYKELRKRLKRWKGIDKVWKILNIDINSLQILYNQVIPFIKERIGNRSIKLRSTYRFKIPRTEWIKKWFTIVIARNDKNEPYDIIFRKCISKLLELKEIGVIQLKAFPQKRELVYIEYTPYAKPIPFPYSIHPETLLTKYKNILVDYIRKYVRNEATHLRFNEIDLEYYVNEITKLIEYAIKKKKYVIYKSWLDEKRSIMYKLPEIVGDVEIDTTRYRKRPILEIYDYGDSFEIMIYKPKVNRISFTTVYAVYDNGNITFYIEEPIEDTLSLIKEIKVHSDGKVELGKPFLFDLETAELIGLYILNKVTNERDVREIGKLIRKRLKLIEEIAKGHKELIEKLKKLKIKEETPINEPNHENHETSNLDIVDL